MEATEHDDDNPTLSVATPTQDSISTLHEPREANKTRRWQTYTERRDAKNITSVYSYGKNR
jgi:hypothetical protein